MAPGAQNDTIVSKREAAALAGFSSSTLEREVRSGRFPAPIRLSRRRIGWRQSDISQWMESLKSRSMK
jgi:prophage regulatory protein